MASLSELKRTSKRSYRRVGRGQGSRRGKTSGRGGKGQTARAGHKIRPELRDIIKKLPKRRGYGKNRGRTVNTMRVRAAVFTLAQIGKLFESGSMLSPAVFKEKGLIVRLKAGVKIIGNETANKYMLTGCTVSKAAHVAIEKAGGKVEL